MIKVLLVDDHELVRTGFRRILESALDIEVVGEVSSGEDALAMVDAVRPDVVLMDVKMPGMGGIEATRRIAGAYPHVRVIGLTICENEPFPEQLNEAGALGYLSKGCPAAELMDAIRTVTRGKRFVSSELARRMSIANLQGRAPGDPSARLSARELQVAVMISQALTTKEIADALCISPKTISTYRQRIYEKLQVANDVELTHLAVRHRLVTVDEEPQRSA
jgi:two-component system invasion response regulator UvrY